MLICAICENKLFESEALTYSKAKCSCKKFNAFHETV